MKGMGWALLAAVMHVAGAAVACVAVLVDAQQLQELYVVAGALLIASWVLIMRTMSAWVGDNSWRHILVGWIP